MDPSGAELPEAAAERRQVALDWATSRRRGGLGGLRVVPPQRVRLASKQHSVAAYQGGAASKSTVPTPTVP